MAPAPSGQRTPDDGWAACAPGAVDRLSRRLHARRQRRQLLQSAAGTAVAAVAVGGVAVLANVLGRGRPGADDPEIAGIRCSEVKQLAPDYAAGTLDAARRQQVAQHVGECPKCGAFYRAQGLIG